MKFTTATLATGLLLLCLSTSAAPIIDDHVRRPPAPPIEGDVSSLDASIFHDLPGPVVPDSLPKIMNDSHKRLVCHPHPINGGRKCPPSDRGRRYKTIKEMLRDGGRRLEAESVTLDNPVYEGEASADEEESVNVKRNNVTDDGKGKEKNEKEELRKAMEELRKAKEEQRKMWVENRIIDWGVVQE